MQLNFDIETLQVLYAFFEITNGSRVLGECNVYTKLVSFEVCVIVKTTTERPSVYTIPESFRTVVTGTAAQGRGRGGGHVPPIFLKFY